MLRVKKAAPRLIKYPAIMEGMIDPVEAHIHILTTL
jgi:hypothetical protein